MTIILTAEGRTKSTTLEILVETNFKDFHSISSHNSKRKRMSGDGNC